ncbi:unnamed protein product [Durusdinium trenchii]|uniref:UVR domain-containing protein n=1 Tax=Durusdinium trenchii TaxID=1381693 RepID=A0ABP0NI97_9DINO
MAPSGMRSLRLGVAALVAASQLHGRSFTTFVQSIAAPLRALPHAPEQGAPQLGTSLGSKGSHATLAACMVAAAFGRQFRTRRRAEDGDVRSSDKARKVEKSLTDEVVEEMDRKMVECAQAGDFTGAARLRDKLCSSQLEDEGTVLQANVEFYASFSQRDLERMKACWFPSALAQCIHPYDKMLNGCSEISESFRRLFEESKTKSRIVPDEVKVSLRGATAVVTCQEKVVLKQRIQSILLTTHVFRRAAQGKWLLMHRHASTPPGDDESVGAWNARLQQLMRAAQTLGPGTSQFIINAANPIYDDDGDGPFGISGRLDDEDLSPDDDESDEPHDSDDEIYVEEEDDMEDARDAWRSLRKLARDRVISRGDKVLLLAEMTQNPGESIVEKAHRLLLRDVPDAEEKDAWEDFGELISFQVKRMQTSENR